MGESSMPLKKMIHRVLGEENYEGLAALRERVKNFAFNLSTAGQRSQRGLLALRDQYAGRRCFVIGNGPSLKKLDLTKLQNEITIGSNGLFLLFGEMGFVPTIYTIEDRLVAHERSQEANAISGSMKIYPSDFRTVLRDAEDTFWLNFQRAYKPFPQFSNDLSRICYWGGTVSFLNLQIAFWLGCSPVYLIGFDHSYVIPPSAEVDGKVITSRSDDPNHFNPNYFGSGYRWHDPNVERMERSYLLAHSKFSKAGKGIFNATAGGKLEVFPRCEYRDLFQI